MALLLLHLPTLALNATATLVYPLYSSYKAVTSSNTSLAEMEVWLVYWSVFACWTLFESLFGWLWSWMPFYYEIRLLFNVWLVAPQTRGATYIYTNHLHPFLQSNQEQIDAMIEDAKRTLKGKVDGYLGGLWSASLSSSSSNEVPQAAAGGKEARHRPPGPAASAPAPPTQHNPAQAPMSMFGNLLKTYAPVAIASAKTFLESKAPPPNTTAAYSIPPSGSGNVNDQRKREEAMQRRRNLESQLAALDASGIPSSTSSSSNDSDDNSGAPAPVTMIHPKNTPRSSFGGAASNMASLRNRVVSAGSGRTVKAGQAMGESYDLLDQNDLGPHPGQTSPRSPARSWMPWSPNSNSNSSNNNNHNG